MVSRWVVLFTVVTLAGAQGDEPAESDKTAAVDKVIQLLEDLQSKVQAEGLAEAKTYDKFACFCKDTVTEKQDNIQAGKDEKETLSAKITELTAKREELDSDIQKLEEEIKEKEKEIKKLKKENKIALEKYAINSADLKNALKGLDGAIKVLKANKDSISFAQLPKEVKDDVQSAALMADALGLSKSKAMSAFLQEEPEKEAEMEDMSVDELKVKDYEFHAGDIVGTLEKLQTEFKAKKKEVDDEEKARKEKYDADLKAAEDYIKEKEKIMEDKKKERDETIADLATASQDFSGVSAQFLDDQKYLQELVVICSEKAKTWDVRQQVRTDELQALAAATGIIKGTVHEKTSSATVRLIQKKFSAFKAEHLVRDESAMEAVEADAEKHEDSGAFPLGFLQRRQTPHLHLGVHMADRELQRELDHPVTVVSTKKHDVTPVSIGSSADGAKAMVMSLLRKQGAALHSAMLTSLAAKLEKDPFAKVKKLIQELIERMLAQAAEEANQKGWCDKALADARQTRDYTAEDLAKINAQMAELEARRDKLLEELKVLEKDIKELEDAQEKADKTRAEEKEENLATISEAKEGLGAVQKAIEILDRFYKTAAKSKVFAQQSPEEDMPDAGFEAGEAYTGAQGEAGGVIGMLEVIESDFTRTVEETEKAEEEARVAHLKFTTETQSSLSAKREAEKIRTRQKDETLEKLAAAQDALDSKTETLINTIKELKSLHDTCIDTGMTYEERVAAREEEIAALKKALCIFEAYQEMGPEGAGNAC